MSFIRIAIDEDINRTMNRYENLRNRSKPEPFLSSFVEKNAMNDIPMRQKSKKSNNPPSNINRQNNPQPKLNVQPDPSESVDDVFDIFSNPKPSNNIGRDHPLDLFDVSQPVVAMNMNQNPNIMPQPQTQQQQQPQKVDPTTDLQNKLKMIYENPQNDNNMQQGMYPNLSGIGPNVMMNNQPNPMPMNNPSPIGVPMNQPNPYSGIGIQQNNNMGMNPPINPNMSSNLPAPVNPQQGSVMQYPSMIGIDGIKIIITNHK